MPIYFDPANLPEPLSVITFSRRDETGEVRTLQHFTLTRAAPHETKAGEASALLSWATGCMDCGASFNFTSGPSTGSFYRRCKKCRRGKQPGGWPTGPRIRHVLTAVEPEIDPASLF